MEKDRCYEIMTFKASEAYSYNNNSFYDCNFKISLLKSLPRDKTLYVKVDAIFIPYCNLPYSTVPQIQVVLTSVNQINLFKSGNTIGSAMVSTGANVVGDGYSLAFVEDFKKTDQLNGLAISKHDFENNIINIKLLDFNDNLITDDSQFNNWVVRLVIYCK